MWDVEIWLVAINGDVSDEEARGFWNIKEVPALRALIGSAPSLRLGVTEPPLPDNEGKRGSVGRVCDLLFLRGTIPVYQLPVIEPGLERELLEAFLPQQNDPDCEGAHIETLAAFLAEHRGAHLAPRENPLYSN